MEHMRRVGTGRRPQDRQADQSQRLRLLRQVVAITSEAITFSQAGGSAAGSAKSTNLACPASPRAQQSRPASRRAVPYPARGRLCPLALRWNTESELVAAMPSSLNGCGEMDPRDC